MPTATATPTGKKCNARKVSIGDFYSRNSYGRVVATEPDGSIIVQNESGDSWGIDRDIFEAEFNTADQFNKTEKVTRTEMVNKIVSSARVVMTIFFRKKPEHKDLVDTVEQLVSSNGRPLSRRALSAKLKEATAGAERTMVGRHYGTTDEFGRIQFLDVEKGSSGTGLKTVDPRTVEWCIIENVRYEVK